MLHVLFRKLRTLKAKLFISLFIGERVNAIHEAVLRDSLEAIKRSPRYQNPKSLIPHGYALYSQNEEDGMIREIFNRIGTAGKTFVEFGVEYGLENNTLALLFEDWKGLWIEGDKGSVDLVRSGFAKTIARGRLQITNSFITRDNINELISAAGFSGDLDLLSVDIDGNDFHIIDAITCVRPRVIVVEYNAKFPPPIRYCMQYDPAHVSNQDDCFGASLKFFEEELSKKGYDLVGCCVAGANAFFVRKDLTGDKFQAPFTAENHYEPPRYHFIGIQTGHKASYAALEKAL